MGTGTFLKRQAIVLGLWVFALLGAVSPVVAQTYLSEDFEAAFTGSPAAPPGWTQSRLVLIGDGVPDAVGTDGEHDWEQNTWNGTVWAKISTGGTRPAGARSGTGVLYMNDYNFGSPTAAAFGNRRIETPTVNLSSSTSPFVRFMLFSAYGSDRLHIRVMGSSNNGATWQALQWVTSNIDSTSIVAAAAWDRINVKIPASMQVASAKFAIELIPTYGTQDVWIDNFRIEEFAPTTLTAVASGNWNNPATWGLTAGFPNSDYNVVIPAGITVSANVNSARVQDVTIDGTLQYSGTSGTQLLHIQGNLTINVGGTYFSGNGTTGKRTYLSGDLINNGTVNFSPGTSATGALYWIGGVAAQTFVNNGILTNGRIPIVYHANPLGVVYNSPITISNTMGLMEGPVTTNGNLTLGNAPASATTHIVYRVRGSLDVAPTYNTTNITRFSTQYNTNIGTTTFNYAAAPTTVITGEELPALSGGFTMSTHDHIELGRPTTVDGASSAVTFTRGILISTSTNLLTLGAIPTGSTGTAPGTTVPSGNHGSYVVGPVKFIFPTTGSATRTFPLGQGTQFNPTNGTLSTNARRQVALALVTGTWTGTEVTAEIVGKPSGSVNTPLTAVMGTRAYRLTQSGPALPTATTVQLNGLNVANSLSDSLVGDVAGLRVAQSASLTGPWTERSATSGTGALVTGTLYTRTTATGAPGPISTDEFFAFATTSPLGNLALSQVLFPNQANNACFGTDSAVVRITNNGAGTTNFATDTFVVSVRTTGAVTQTISRVIKTGTLAPGQSRTYNVGNLNLGTPGTYNIRAWVKQANDPDATNDSSAAFNLINGEINTFPALQNFESFTSGNGTSTVGTLGGGWANLVNGSGDDFDWFVFNGATPTTGTGPNVDRTLGTSAGKYMYIRGAATGATPNRTATLLSPCVNLATNTAPRLAFFYHMAGSAVGNLNVDVLSGGNWTTVFTLSGSQQTSEADAWREAIVDLSAYTGQLIRVRFRATTLTGTSTDIAIDNVRFTQASAVDLVLAEISTPLLGGCRSAAETVSVRVRNDGTAAQSNIPLTVAVTGPTIATLTGTLAGPLAPGQIALVTLNGSFNMQPGGTYAFTASVDMPGDADQSNDTLRATRVSVNRVAIPYSENFNGVAEQAIPAGWLRDNGSADDFSVRASWGSLTVPQGVGGSKALVTNLWNANTTSFAVTPLFASIPANAVLSFDYSIINWTGGATTLGAGDTIFIDVSTDCGTSFQDFAVINGGNHTPSTGFTKFTRCLSAFAGQDVYISVFGRWGAGDYIIAIDNFNISVPAAPTASGVARCGAASVTLNATGSGVGTLNWYATRTSTTSLATGASYTASFTNSDSVFVAEVVGACIGERRRVDVTINPIPAAPTVPTPTAICAGTAATFTPDPVSGVSFLYFNAASGGTQLGSGASYTSGTLSADLTVHVAAVQGPCTSATRTAVTVTVNALPAAPVVPNPTAICNGNTATFVPTPVSGVSFLYFDAASGGTQLGSGASFVSGTLTSDFTVHVAAVQNGCTSATRTASTVTVFAIPAAPTVPTPGAICSGQTATFTPDPVSGVSFLFFDAPSGGNVLATGASYTTGALTSNFTVHVVAVQNGCTSATRTASTVTVAASAPAPTVPTPAAACNGSTATFIPTPVSGTTFTYWDAATGGTQLGSGASFTTGALTANFTVHVEAVQGTCTSSTRTASTVTVNSLPAAPIVPNPSAICSGNTATFTPFPSAGVSFVYFDAATGGTQLGSGASYTSGALTANLTVFTAAVQNGCTSATRSASTVTVNALPAVPTVPTPSAVCSGTPATFTPTPATGVSFLYFDAATGGAQLGSGASFTTGNLTADFTVHVAAVQNGCTSATRTASTVTVNALPANGGSLTTFVCGPGASLNVSVPNPVTGVTYNWYDAATGGNLVNTGTTYAWVSAGTITLHVEAVQNGCTSATRGVYQLDQRTVPAAPAAVGDTVCAGQNVTVTATASAGGTLTWWDAANGGAQLGNGTSLTLTAPTGSQTVYVQEELNGCTSARTAVEAGIQQIPAAPTAPDTVKICTNSTASLAATAPGTITWWDAASGGNLLFTGIQYTTSALTTSQSFFVQTEVNGCVSPRAEVFVEVGNTLGAPLARDTAICAGRTATLAALGSGTLSWYDVATGGTALGTGFFYTTPALNSTDTFYVEAVQGTCVSTRTLVVVTVNAAPVAFTVAGATTAVEATQETYTINNPETGVTYSWSVTGGTPATATGTSLQVTWGTPGTGTITIEGENANGCVVTTVVNVTINSATSVVPGLQTTFSMSQNYPNPSFDQTSIDVLLPSGQYGVISVFDLNAKLVERISTDVSNGAPMTILLNTSRLTAGVYTYTLEAPAGAITRRLTIVK